MIVAIDSETSTPFVYEAELMAKVRYYLAETDVGMECGSVGDRPAVEWA